MPTFPRRIAHKQEFPPSCILCPHMQEADGDDRAADTSTSGRLGGSGGGGFRCDLCAMQCNSYQAYENHLLSKKHAVG